MKKIKLPLLIILIIVLMFNPGASIIQAYNHNPNTVFDNSFEQNDETILPFILENSEQTITKKYIEEQCQKAGFTFENKDSLNDIIKTGDKIVTDNKTYTVLLYGDIDANGKINVFDAQKALKHYVYEDCTLTGIYVIAANVNNNTEIVDSFDAQRILKFWVGTDTNLLVNEPISSLEREDVPPALAEIVKVPYGTLLADIKLQSGWKFDNITDKTTVGDVGENTFAVTYTPTDVNGKIIHDKVTIIVEKAVPQNVPELPTNLTAKAGDLLSTIKLPQGWEFDNMTSLSTVGDAGKNEFAVTYTPEDSKNYQTKSDVVSIDVSEETEKLVNVILVGNTINAYRYDNNYNEKKVATIKSSNNIPLTSNCKVEFNIQGPENSKEAIATGKFSTVVGEENQYDIYLYAPKAGEYTITPVISGTQVKNGKLLGTPIKVTVVENYELTDITVDGKLLTENVETNTETIEAKIGKSLRKDIKFYHVYKDINGTELARVQLPDEKLSDINITFPGETTNVKKPGIYNGETPVNWDAENGTNDYIPNNILLEGKTEGTENVEINIHKVDGNINFSRSMKINVSKVQTKDIILGSMSIELLTYQPAYNTVTIAGEERKYAIIGENDKEYTVVEGTSNGVTYDYTILPIKLKDEFGDDLEILANKIIAKESAKNRAGYVTFVEETNNIEIKGFCLVEGHYVDADSIGATKIDAVGIALKDKTKNISNIEIYYDNMGERSHKDLSVSCVKEKIEGIVAEKIENIEVYRYDNNYNEKKIAVLSSSNGALLTEDLKIELKLDGPTGYETKSKVEGSFSTTEQGKYNIYLYANIAGEYTITPTVSGSNVRNGKIVGEPIKITVVENYELTDITVDGKLLTESVGVDTEAIEAKMGKNLRKDIKFYHIYKDTNGTELARVQLPDEKLSDVNVTFQGETTNVEKPSIYNGETPIGWDAESGTNDYIPNNILLEGKTEGTENIEINIHKVDGNISLSRSMKINVTKLQTKDITLGSTSIELLTYQPVYNTVTIAGEERKYATIGENGKEYTVVEGTSNGVTYDYTILPIKLKDEFGDDLEILANKIIAKESAKNRAGYVTFVEETNNIEIKGFCLVEGHYVDADSIGATKIDAIGIALKDKTKNINNIEIYYDDMDNITGRSQKDLSVSCPPKPTTEATNETYSEKLNNMNNTVDGNSINAKTPNTTTINANAIKNNNINSNTINSNTITNNTINSNKNTITSNTIQNTLNSNTINKNEIGNTIN